mmetsp:Transcript_93841/g.165530  ORF Transcript_93841/g.165530 Transcript_93841/m.165530 type:complete len:771 (+) Transcript_93841:48-2360(+)
MQRQIRIVQMMPFAAVLLAYLLGAISGDRARQPLTNHFMATENSLLKQENPLKRVVNLLTKMKEELSGEAEADAKMYDKQACWCQTNRKEKTSAIESANAKEESLKSEIEELTSKLTRLEGDIDASKKSKGEAEEAIKEAEALRKTEHAKHFELEQSLVKSITSLKNALVMLSKYNSFQQIPPTVLLSMKTVLRDLAMKHELLTGVGTPSSSPLARRVRTAFLSLNSDSERSRSQSETGRLNSELLGALDVSGPGMSYALPVDYAERLLAEAAHAKGPIASASTFLQVDSEEKYKPKSGSLIEALEKMLQDMKTELKDARDKEAKADKDHKALLKAKDAELTSIMDAVDEYQSEHASSKRLLAQAKQDLIQTTDTKEADGKFLQELKITCETYEKEYKKRSHTRSEEVKAVSEAMAVLTEDDAREHLDKTVSLLQTRAATRESVASRLRRSRAAEALHSADSDEDAEDLLSAWHGRHIRSFGKATQQSSRHTVLEMLAMKTELEPMPEVTQAMDEMIADLKSEQKEEVDQKASCKDKLHSNKMDMMDTSAAIKDLKAQLEGSDLQASVVKKDMEAAKEEKAKLAARVEEAAENHKEEVEESKMVTLDQQKTQDILKAALDKLKAFYAFVQTDGSESPEYEKHGASSAVMMLIKQIIEDSEMLVMETKKATEDGKAEFEAFKSKAATLDTQLDDTLTMKKEELAMLDMTRTDTASSLANKKSTLKSLEDMKAALDDECGFLLKNFELRQKARLKEIEGVQSAKAIILGEKP